MNVIKRERLGSVEPITKVVGITEDGDMLIEDRNGVRYSMEAALLPKPKSEPEPEQVWKVAAVVGAPPNPEPTPKPKRKPRAKKAK